MFPPVPHYSKSTQVISLHQVIQELKLVADKSPCKKRKVGCIIAEHYKPAPVEGIIHQRYIIRASGYNFHPDGEVCENYSEQQGKFITDPKVIHAEVNAIDNFVDYIRANVKYIVNPEDYTVFVTYAPCKNCQEYARKHGFNQFKLITGAELMSSDTELRTTSVDDVLKERGSRYGEFKDHAKIAQDLKDIMRATPGWQRLNPMQKETLEMNAHKTARILNGDPDYKDNWVDIEGYTKLVSKTLTE